MSEYQFQGDYGAAAATQTTLRKKWSNLAMTTAVMNALLFLHIFFAPFILSVMLGIPAEARKISFSGYNDYLNIALMEGSIYIVLSIMALVVNIRFFRSLRPAQYTAAPANQTRNVTIFRAKKIATGILIAFPSSALATVIVNLIFILYS